MISDVAGIGYGTEPDVGGKGRGPNRKARGEQPGKAETTLPACDF